MRIAFFSIVAASLLYSADPTAGAKGANIANTALSVFGSKDGVNNRLGQPLMSNTKMTTLDGTKSFDAQMQCPASSKSIGITFIPSGGNDYRLIIKQDTNLDGTYDYTYDSNSLARTLSGVCTNGTLMCNPSGSWSDCKSYVWDTNNKQVYLQEVPTGSSKLGACYCSNSSCGVSTLAPQIYENIGGGISAAIMKSNPLFILSKSEWSFADMTYYLYGQDKTNCTGLGGSNWDKYGEKNPTIYYDAQTPPNTSIADVAIDQGSDPTSYYSMISHQNEVAYNSAGDKIDMPTQLSCVVTNTPYYSKQRYVTDGGCETSFSCSGGVVDLGDGIFKCGVSSVPSGCGVAYSLNVCGTFGVNWSIPDDARIFFNVVGGNSLATSADSSGEGNAASGTVVINSVDGSVQCSGGGDTRCLSSSTGVANKQISINASFYNDRSCGDGGSATGSAYILLKRYEDSEIKQSSNCPTDESCRIVSEQVCNSNGQNCVYTVRDGVRQQAVVQKDCQIISTEVGQYAVCADGNSIKQDSKDFGVSILMSAPNSWFHIKRVYSCGKQSINIDTSKMTRAASTAYKTSTSATTMTYTDADGVVQTVNNLPSGSECPTPVCTVKKPSVSTDQFSDGTNRGQMIVGAGTVEKYVRTCTGESPVLTCPLEAGETMIEGCSCSGNWTGFQQAVTTLGAVSEAAKDMICSQN